MHGFPWDQTGICLGLVILTAAPGYPVQLADGTVYFAQIPQLVAANTSDNFVSSSFATYSFSLSLPVNAGVPLQSVAITQSNGITPIAFLLEETQVSVNGQRPTRINLDAVRYSPQTSTVTVQFNPPVAPGQSVVIQLKPRSNPQIGNDYLFGITAFPQGEKSYGQFLGYARIAIVNFSGR